MSAPAHKPSIATALPLTPAQRRSAEVMALAYANELVGDQRRVQSIIWSMSDALRLNIEEGQKGDDKIATAEPEAFMQNILWLLNVLELSAGAFINTLDDACPEQQQVTP